MKKNRTPKRARRGFMILEVLLALLIFSLGVLGLVGLQARTVAQSGQAQYRATATVLANELIGTMWAGKHDSATLQSTYATGSTDAGYVAWQAKVAAALPQGSTYPPTVTVTQVSPLTLIIPAGNTSTPPTPDPSTLVTVTLKWKLPSEPANDPVHNIVVVTQIK